MKKKNIDKKNKKLADKKCYFCDEANYALLDVHRIKPGCEGGEYQELNTITVCSNHHRIIHAGEITIDRKYLRSDGKWVVHYWKDGEEYWSQDKYYWTYLED